MNYDFKKLIPPPSPDELRLLEDSIRTEGCREAILVWNGHVVDGHNRLEICNRLGVKYATKPMQFADENAARIWILKNQFGRRNLSGGQRAALAIKLGRLEEAAAEAHERKKQSPGRPTTGAENIGPTGPKFFGPKSTEKVGVEIGVGSSTVFRTQYVAEKDPVAFEKVASGEVTAYAAYEAIRKRERPAMAPLRSGPIRPVDNLPKSLNRDLLPNWCDKIISQVRGDFLNGIKLLDSVQKPLDGNSGVTGYHLREVQRVQQEMRDSYARLCFPVPTDAAWSQAPATSPTPTAREARVIENQKRVERKEAF